MHGHVLKMLSSIGSVLFISLLLLNPGMYAGVFEPDMQVNANFLHNDYDSFSDYRFNTDETVATAYAASENSSDTHRLESYIVKSGDDLNEIAAKYAVSADRIRKINNLGDHDIHPDQRLYITTMDGIIYPVLEDKISLMVFANKYGVDIDLLMKANNQTNEMVPYERGQAIFVPGFSLEDAYKLSMLIKPAPKPKEEKVVRNITPSTPTTSVSSNYTPKPSDNQAPARSQTISQSSYGGDKVVASYRNVFQEQNGMAAGQCTYYAAHKATFAFPEISPGVRFRSRGGNANQWLNNARNAGFKTSATPTPGAIAVFQGGYGYYSIYGHVAVVHEVDRDNHRMKISDMNYQGLRVVTERWVQLDDTLTRSPGSNLSLLGFIPVQDMPAAVQARYDAARGL